MHNPIKVVAGAISNTTDNIVNAVKSSIEDAIANGIAKKVEEKIAKLEYPIVVNMTVNIEIKL